MLEGVDSSIPRDDRVCDYIRAAIYATVYRIVMGKRDEEQEEAYSSCLLALEIPIVASKIQPGHLIF
jgi:hypothetical protein